MKMLHATSKIDILQEIGSRLRHFRLSKALTQEELAEIAGFTRSYYTEIETGKRNISIMNLHKLALALNVSLKDLVDIG